MRSVTRRRFLAVAGSIASAAALRAPVAASPRVDARAVTEIAAAHRILENHGAMDGGGFVSTRDGRERFFLTGPSGSGGVRSHELCDLRSDEPMRAMHAAIYRARLDVDAIVLASSTSVACVAECGAPLRAIGYGSDFLTAGVPAFDARGAWTAEVAAALARALGAAPALVVLGVGLVVVAPTLAEAVARGVYAEASARLHARAVGFAGDLT